MSDHKTLGCEPIVCFACLKLLNATQLRPSISIIVIFTGVKQNRKWNIESVVYTTTGPTQHKRELFYAGYSHTLPLHLSLCNMYKIKAVYTDSYAWLGTSARPCPNMPQSQMDETSTTLQYIMLLVCSTFNPHVRTRHITQITHHQPHRKPQNLHNTLSQLNMNG